jgi:hypothetical protein
MTTPHFPVLIQPYRRQAVYFTMKQHKNACRSVLISRRAHLEGVATTGGLEDQAWEESASDATSILYVSAVHGPIPTHPRMIASCGYM